LLCKSTSGIKIVTNNTKVMTKNIFNEIKPYYKLLHTNTKTEKTFVFMLKRGIVLQHVYTHVLNG
jgi:hypothetical protein